MSNSIILIMSDKPTARLFESRPHCVGWRHHVLHMHMRPCPLNLDGSDEGYHYSEPCDYYISISLLLSGCKIHILYSYNLRAVFLVHLLDARRRALVWPWRAHHRIMTHLPQVVSWSDGPISYYHQPQAVADRAIYDICLSELEEGAESLTYLSSAFHSVSGGMLTSTCGQAGQNNAKPPSTGWSGRSWTTPARIRLWRSLHCR